MRLANIANNSYWLVAKFKAYNHLYSIAMVVAVIMLAMLFIVLAVLAVLAVVAMLAMKS